MKKPLSILLVDDHPIFLKGLIEVLLEELPETQLQAFTLPEKALEHAHSTGYDIAILDLDMPIMNGIDLSTALKTIDPTLKTILLTMHKEVDIIRSVMARGIEGYVLKDDAVDELVLAIKTILKGKPYCSITPLSDHPTEQLEVLRSLTKTELLILTRISNNKTSREIAEELFVSIKTIENHRNNISRKLQLQGSNNLLKFAISKKRFLE